MINSKSIHNIFDLLEDWKELPAYQLERRLDIFFAIYMDKFFLDLFNERVIDIIPEFPIHRGTIGYMESMNKSFKVDYAVFCESGLVYLLELKTDNSSTREAQFEYYRKTLKVGLANIIAGIEKLQSKTKARTRPKYKHLTSKLKSIGVIDEESRFNAKFRFLETPLIILPRIEDDLTNIKQFDFNKFSSVVSSFDDPLSKLFSKKLKDWGRDEISQ